MFLSTSADIIDEHAKLEATVTLIDGVFEETTSEVVLQPNQLAKFGRVDQNQVMSALEIFA